MALRFTLGVGSLLGTLASSSLSSTTPSSTSASGELSSWQASRFDPVMLRRITSSLTLVLKKAEDGETNDYIVFGYCAALLLKAIRGITLAPIPLRIGIKLFCRNVP